MDPQKVSVSFDPANGSLSVDKPSITLNDPNDTVSWFPPADSPFPDGASLLIAFEDPLGPFQVIRSVNSQNLLAKGNTGTVKTFSYRLFLLLGSQGSEPAPGTRLVMGGPFTVDNRTTRNLFPKVTITANPLPGGGWELVPPPEPISLYQGDNVLLEIPGLPPGFVPTFRFPEGNDDLGLFPAFFTVRQDQDPDPDSRLFVATFGSDQVGPAHYDITVWGTDGQFVTFKDPSIDGLGKPPGT